MRKVLGFGLSAFIIFTLLSTLALGAGKEFDPNYNATFTGDVEGGGLVEVIGNSIDISSNVACNDFELTFSDLFGDYSGTHYGYLHMERDSAIDSTMEIFYTYGPDEDGYYYQLHGFGVFEGNKKEGWFTVVSIGTFTLAKSGEVTGWEWITVWEGEPSFNIVGEKI